MLSSQMRVDEGDSRYHVIRRLAVGGMAEICLARATGIEGFEKHVVVKRILPEHAEDQQFVDMFLDEARLAAMLHHHNIAQVYDIGRIDGSYFFSMEYLHGQDVRAILKRIAGGDERVPLPHALTIVAGTAAGLHYAHEKKGPDGRPLDLVHRDVSPSNILVTYDGGVKVVDFGIARASQRRSGETRSGTLKGKVAYMSPEQCLEATADCRSDIFSLGIVLYELTTGSRLFRDEPSDYAVMRRIVKGKFDAPSQRASDYPEQLEKITMRALAVDPRQRYPSAQEFLSDLESFAAEQRIPLSTSALAAYVVELFGLPPEPWLENSAGVAAGAAVPPAAASAPLAADKLEGSHVTVALSQDTTPLDMSQMLARSVGVDPAQLPDLAPVTSAQDDIAATVEPRSPARRRRRFAALLCTGVAVVLVGVAGLLTLTRSAHHPRAAMSVDGSAPVAKPDAPIAAQDVAIAVGEGASSTAATPAPAAVTEPAARAAASEAPARPPPESPPPSPAKAAASRKPGYLSIASLPIYSTIYVDGKRIDDTPILRLELASGKHSVRAVTPDGRSKRMSIRIRPGRTSHKRIVW